MEFSSLGDEPSQDGAGLVPPLPDDVDLVTEAAAMISVFAAQRFARVDVLRRNALADASRYGGAVAEVVERSVRLEVAAALRIHRACRRRSAGGGRGARTSVSRRAGVFGARGDHGTARADAGLPP